MDGFEESNKKALGNCDNKPAMKRKRTPVKREDVQASSDSEVIIVSVTQNAPPVIRESVEQPEAGKGQSGDSGVFHSPSFDGASSAGKWKGKMKATEQPKDLEVAEDVEMAEARFQETSRTSTPRMPGNQQNQDLGILVGDGGMGMLESFNKLSFAEDAPGFEGIPTKISPVNAVPFPTSKSMREDVSQIFYLTALTYICFCT